jgi:hypothetical protein
MQQNPHNRSSWKSTEVSEPSGFAYDKRGSGYPLPLFVFPCDPEAAESSL